MWSGVCNRMGVLVEALSTKTCQHMPKLVDIFVHAAVISTWRSIGMSDSSRRTTAMMHEAVCEKP